MITESVETTTEHGTGEQLVVLHPVPDTAEMVAVGSETVDEATTTVDSAGHDEPVHAVGDVREQARVAWRASVTAGEPLTGRELAEKFERSERWGRDRIAEVRHAGNGTDGTPATARRRRARADATKSRAKPAAANRETGTDVGRETAGGHGNVRPAGDPAADARSVDVPAHPGVPPSALPDNAGVSVLPAGARLVAWAGFLFGTAISVAANVLHAWLPALVHQAPAPGLAPQVGAAVWPIALVISVEVLSRVPWRTGWSWRLARYGGAGVVALGAAVISYGHLHGVLAAWGYGTTGAAVGPLVVDGLMTISGFALLAMSSHGGKAADR